MESLVCHFAHHFDCIIWKQGLDTTTGILTLELRDPETRSVKFQCITLKDGRVFEAHIPEQEDWWIGLEQTNHGIALIHHYLQDEQPVRNGLDCYSLPDWQLLWQQEDGRFLSMNAHTVSIEKEGERLEIDLSSTPKTHIQETVRFFPEQYSADHAHFNTVAQFLRAEFNVIAVEGLEYLEYENLICISYYIYSEQKLENYLMVINDRKELLFQDCLGTHLSGIALDTFFIYDTQLLFVKQKSELIGLLLP